MKEKEKFSKIASSPISRGMSLMGLTLQSGKSYASMKLKQFLPGRENKEEELLRFIGQQTTQFVLEIGKLKGSIMKAGQLLSIYGEYFFPPEINNILKTLQSNSAPMEWEVMEAVLKRQWSAEVFAKFTIDKKPIAAASLGQVFKARLEGCSKDVVIKVQYPGVDRSIDSDLKALKQILAVCHLIPKGPSFDEIYKEIRMMLHHEVNYLRELEILQQYREWLCDDPRFIVPEVYPQYCTKRILVMDYESGVDLDSEKTLSLPQVRKNELALAFLELAFKEVFVWRTVQTDPHFGNYKIQIKDEYAKIVLFDFGAVRVFSKNYIQLFAKLSFSAINRDSNENTRIGKELGFLFEEDKENVLKLFNEICFAAATPFALDENCNPYEWEQDEFLKHLSGLAKNAVFAFRFRSPPREAVFLDRKMIGTYMIVKTLRLKAEARTLLLKYLEPWVN